MREAADSLIDGMADGTVRNRSGDPYKPSVVRGYRAHLKRHVLPALGGLKLDAVRRADVQGLCNRLVADGASPSTVRNAIMPLRVLYRRALRAGQVAVSPLEHLELPAVRGTRDRVASPDEAAALLAALPAGDRAVWATALYVGLCLGELRALRVEDVDLDKDGSASSAPGRHRKARSSRRAAAAAGGCRSPRSCAGTWASTSWDRGVARV